MKSEYEYIPGHFFVTDTMKRDYKENGYIIVRGLFNKKEISHVCDAVEHPDGVTKYAYGVDDGETSSKMALWRHPGDDVTGMIARCERVAMTAETLLDGEVYHYHSKLMMKDAYTGGRFVWHQDYGYWYNNGCIFPDMATVFIALDAAERENGCLQIIPGSHRCGRIDHLMVTGQTGADVARVNQILDFGLPLVHVELKQGDAIFFHCNLLHKSEQNHSARRRWALLVAFNRADNNPVIEHHCPRYTPMLKVPDESVLTCSNITGLDGKSFLDPKDDMHIIVREDRKCQD